MNTRVRDESSTTDREIALSRVVDAPREAVFVAWTEPEQVADWWGPDGFTNTIGEMEVRPGGVWRFVMHGPDGVDYPNHIVFIEVVEPERLVYSHRGDDGEAGGTFLVTVTFGELDGKTHVTMTLLFDTVEHHDRVVEEFSMIDGGKQALGRLARFVKGV